MKETLQQAIESMKFPDNAFVPYCNLTDERKAAVDAAGVENCKYWCHVVRRWVPAQRLAECDSYKINADFQLESEPLEFIDIEVIRYGDCLQLGKVAPLRNFIRLEVQCLNPLFRGYHYKNKGETVVIIQDRVAFHLAEGNKPFARFKNPQ